MARTKPKKEPVLQSWDDVDAALCKIRKAEHRIAKEQLALDKAIIAATEKSAEAVKPFQDEVKELGLHIKEFVTANREALDGKTKKLNFGSTGFRLSTKLVVPRGKEPDVIAALVAMGLDDCVKVTETIRKDVLKQKPQDVILAAGAYMKPSDEFWYETTQEELQDPGE
ncbi:host-nuclease inhibitor Gam family protein [Ruminococcaceae bacterium OttesenSCG-928-A11]|nr:host-nuclease inhibitor Gam family protein [Ruminococcaceae bacterium OttesenSCG-928-A11]